MEAVSVTRGAAERIAAGHPWIYSSDVTARGSASPGDAVLVRDPKRRLLGTAHYSSTSQIALRLLSTREEVIDRAFFLRRIAAALDRRRLVRDSEAYRWVHAEGDFLPALVVDRYAGHLVVQTLSQGMDRALPDIVSCLLELASPEGIVERNDVPRRDREDLPLRSGVLHGAVPGEVPFRMNGLLFHADLLRGQKTGVFLDQRENYVAAARYAHGCALDCFTSTGGFALHLASRCETVEGVDSSEPALAMARRNAEANGLANVRFRAADAFELLAGYRVAGRRFGTIVLDPPAFAKSRGALAGAMRAYREVNYRALQLLGPGGILVTCSCSHHVSEERLAQTVGEAARELGRTLRVLERRAQPPDHPVLLSVPETHYLKCLILEAADAC